MAVTKAVFWSGLNKADILQVENSEGASRLPMVNLFDVEQQTSRGLRAAPFTDFSVSRGGDLMILHARIKAGWI